MCENTKPVIKDDSAYRKTIEYWAEYVEQLKQTTVLNDAGLEVIIPILLREHPTYEWRNHASLRRELGVTDTEIMHALNKLMAKGIVVQNTRNEEHYGLLERVKRSYPSDMWRPSPTNPDDDRCYRQPPILDPHSFHPCPSPEPPEDMMEGMREALREVHKLICTAKKLNDEVAVIGR